MARRGVRLFLFVALVAIEPLTARPARAVTIDTNTTLNSLILQFEGPVDIVDGSNPPTIVEIVDGADIRPNVHVRGQSVLNIRGGLSDSFVIAHDTATLNIFNGLVAAGEDIVAYDSSITNIYGGLFGDDLAAASAATVNLYGGTFLKAGDGATLLVADDAIINVYLRQFELLSVPYFGERLVGVLSDGSAIDVDLWVNPFYLGKRDIVLHVIPEPNLLPGVLIFLLTVSFFGRRQGQRLK
jgi:hypothetical protein